MDVRMQRAPVNVYPTSSLGGHQGALKHDHLNNIAWGAGKLAERTVKVMIDSSILSIL